MHQSLAKFAQPLRSKQTEVGRGRDCPQCRGGATILRPLTTLDVVRAIEVEVAEAVLAGLERLRLRKDEGRAALDHGGIVVEREVAREATAVAHVHAERLDIADREVGAERARCREQTEACRIGTNDSECTVLVGELDNLWRLIVDNAEGVRILDVDGRDIVGERGAQRVEVEQSGLFVERDFIDLNVVAQVVGKDESAIEQECRWHENALASRQHHAAPQRHCGGGRPVVVRRRDNVELDELGHQILELPECLQTPMVAVGIARIRGDELTAPIDLVTDSGHLMLVAAGAKKTQHLGRRRVLVEDASDVATQSSLFGDAFLERQALVVAQLLRHRRVEVINRLGTDDPQHLCAHLGSRVRDVRMGHCSHSTR